MQNNKKSEGLVIFDGECGACLALKNLAQKYDTQGRLEFIPYQSPELANISSSLNPEMASDALYFVEKNGQIVRGAQAVFAAMSHLSGFWGTIGSILSLPGISLLAEPFYRLFARHRHLISRQLRLER